MTPAEKFHDRLGQILDAHTCRDTWFAFWPVRLENGEYAWMRWVNYKQFFHFDGQKLEWRTIYY